MDTPRLKREWIGRYVRLLQDVRNQGGGIFRAGEVMRVLNNRGGLELEVLRHCPLCDRYHFVRDIKGVQEYKVELLPEDYRPEPMQYAGERIADLERQLAAERDARQKGQERIAELERALAEVQATCKAMQEERDLIRATAERCGADIVLHRDKYGHLYSTTTMSEYDGVGKVQWCPCLDRAEAEHEARVQAEAALAAERDARQKAEAARREAFREMAEARADAHAVTSALIELRTRCCDGNIPRSCSDCRLELACKGADNAIHVAAQHGWDEDEEKGLDA